MNYKTSIFRGALESNPVEFDETQKDYVAFLLGRKTGWAFLMGVAFGGLVALLICKL